MHLVYKYLFKKRNNQNHLKILRFSNFLKVPIGSLISRTPHFRYGSRTVFALHGNTFLTRLHATLRFSPVTIRFSPVTLARSHATLARSHATLRFSPVTLARLHATLFRCSRTHWGLYD